jgi:uncharacterized damage-inducible protein DinB
MAQVSEVTERIDGQATAATLAPLVLQLKLNAQVMKTALDGLDAGELTSRPVPRTNSMLWIFGHTIATRAQLLALLGEQIDTGFGDRFNRGAKPEDAANVPLEHIERVNRAITERLDARLAAMTEEQLARPAAGPKLPGAKTLADQIAFYAFHESYHVGQLGYVRKALGHSAVAG